MASAVRRWSPPQIISSAFIAIFAWSAFGFSWFGPGFGWMTHRAATKMSTVAVTESLATICVAQARGSVGADAALEELSGLSIWTQGEFVEEAKWATMPGSESATNGVAELCAVKLREGLPEPGKPSAAQTG